MTFALNTKALAAGLKPMNKAFSKRSTIPVLAGIHVRAGEGIAEFTATDLETAVRFRIEHNTDGLPTETVIADGKGLRRLQRLQRLQRSNGFSGFSGFSGAPDVPRILLAGRLMLAKLPGGESPETPSTGLLDFGAADQVAAANLIHQDIVGHVRKIHSHGTILHKVCETCKFPLATCTNFV